METFLILLFFILFYLFKSYYVVWKHDMVADYGVPNFLFKSYYVVWKPENENDENDIGRRFKSYYVVWKLYLFSLTK